MTSRAHAGWPTLAVALAGSGIVVRTGNPALPTLYAAEEAASARPGDVILAAPSPTTAPFLVSPTGGHPARIGFGYEDMRFGHALVAELIRATPIPAHAEPATARLLADAARVATLPAAVLIEGETGTGKEGLARYIHAMSPRAARPFVAVNCAALPETMAEALLFGHVRGAFTGATTASEGLFGAADGGTLLLDEIGDMPIGLQAKLLRALQEGEILPVGATRPVRIDVRVIAAGNRALAAEVEAGRFRADLYWRLAVMPLTLVPLRERRQDVRAIAAALLIRHARAGYRFAWPTTAALDRLMAHRWPGNVRELDAVLQRALLRAEQGRIEACHLDIPERAANDGTLESIARASEAEAIRRALDATDGHRARAAARLGVSERTLRYRLAEMRVAA